MKLLSTQEIDCLLHDHPTWSLIERVLVREWVWDDFAQAMAFVQKIAILAEQSNHHPDIDIRYNRVRLALISHDAGALTARDRAMVRKIDEQFQNL